MDKGLRTLQLIKSEPFFKQQIEGTTQITTTLFMHSLSNLFSPGVWGPENLKGLCCWLLRI